MKPARRYIALFLVLALTASLFACDKKDIEPDDKTDTDSAEVTTEPHAPTAAEIYTDAVATLSKNTIYSQNIEIEMTKTVGVEVFEESVSRTVEFMDTDSDSFTADVKEQKIIGSNVIKTEEIYRDGNVYLKYKDDDEALYSAPMTKEEYISRHLPLALLDASIYDSITFDETDENLIRFEAPTAAESWLAPEYAVLNSAYGTAELSDSGQIEAFTYTVDYRQGNTDIVAEITVELNKSDSFSKPDVPSDTACTVFDNIDIPIIINDSYYYTLEEPVFSCSSHEVLYSAASACVLEGYDDFYSYGTSNEDFIAKCESTLFTEAYNGTVINNTKTTLTREFDGSTLTTVYNGGEPFTESESVSNIRSFFSAIMTGHYINPSNMESVTVTDTGTFLVIEFSADTSVAEYYEDYTNSRLYSDPDALDSVSDSYRAEKMNGYISIDKDSVLPTAFNIDFEGIHTFDGQDCSLIYQVTRSFNVGSRDCYEEITGEMLPDEEPENKATPLLYEVTSPDGGKMYLFGTIHVGDERTAFLPDELYTALESSDALAVEWDVIDFEQRIKEDEELYNKYFSSQKYGDGTSLSDHVDDELYTDTVIALQTMSITPTENGEYLPSVLASFIENNNISTAHSVSYDRGADMRLLRLAKESGKKILNVESEEDKLAMDSLYSEYTQEFILNSSLYSTRAEYMANVNKAYELWCAGDEDALKEYLREEPDFTDATEEDIAAYEEYNKIMSTDRDAKMLEVAKGYMDSSEVVFFAVGIAHLLGETGLVDAFRADGYTVTLVEYE